MVSRVIIQVLLFEAYNSVVARLLGQVDKKINEAVAMNNCVTMGGGGKLILRTFRSQ